MMYHDSVLVLQSIEGLNIRGEGIYVDTTFGGGGHSKSILQQVGDKGHLYAFDQDEDAKVNAGDWNNFTFIASNFRYLKRWMRYYGVQQIDGLLADLGVSSHQFDEPERGFSYRFDEVLDMRMNQKQGRSAQVLIRELSFRELQQMFYAYTDIPNVRKLTSAIDAARQVGSINTTHQLIQVMDSCIVGNRMKYLSQVFQAFRIEVNDEMGALKELLQEAYDLLAPGGRMVFMSYHSMEDRLVKNFFKSGNFEGSQIKDDFGNIYRPFKILTKKPIVPEEEEVSRNVRARSAKLRIAEKK
jgi:16S rRNA (cytosine1402-N4)-methyltransferase